MNGAEAVVIIGARKTTQAVNFCASCSYENEFGRIKKPLFTAL